MQTIRRHKIASLVLLFSLTLAPLAAAQTTFEDRTQMLFVDPPANSAAAWRDYDGDGYADLLVDGNLWRNEAGQKFTRVEAQVNGGIFGDFDNDGRPDIYSISQRMLLRNTPDAGFVPVALPQLPMNVSRGAAWLDIDNDGDLDLYIGGYELPYHPDVIVRNDGEAGFVIAWQQQGDIDPARGVTPCDYDRDGDTDIYVSNYRLEANLLWENDGQGNFTNVAKQRGVDGIDNGYSYSFGHTIGSVWGDLDNDGLIDLFVGNFSHAHEHQDRPRFYQNLGPDHEYSFKDQSDNAKLKWQESFATPSLVDYDNDGDLDLYFTTVYNGDHAVLYRNDGDWRFTDVTAQVGLAELPPTYQAAWADFNQDGLLDLMTAGRLFINTAEPRHWLRVKLHGDGQHASRDAFGAQVRIQLGDRIVTRQVCSAIGEGNQNELSLHLGLGEHADPVTLKITWPGGTKQTVEVGQTNQTIHITQSLQ